MSACAPHSRRYNRRFPARDYARRPSRAGGAEWLTAALQETLRRRRTAKSRESGKTKDPRAPKTTRARTGGRVVEGRPAAKAAKRKTRVRRRGRAQGQVAEWSKAAPPRKRRNERPACAEDDARKDRWPSGRRRTPGTRVGGQPSRGFESHPVRQLFCRNPEACRVVENLDGNSCGCAHLRRTISSPGGGFLRALWRFWTRKSPAVAK